MNHKEKMLLLTDKKYPLSAKYDPEWIYNNRNGSQSLWLIEGLCQIMDLTPGMKVLDLGCGNAITSIFLAKEYGVSVFAVDVINPTENLARIKDFNLENQVFPIQAEAHRLPFPKGFFDAIISINSYQFFGTADNYTSDYLSHLLKPGGQLGLVLFGPEKEFNGAVPDVLKDSWWPDFYFFHSLEWWKWHIEKSRLFDLRIGDDMNGDGVRITHIWSKVMDHFDESPTYDIMRWNRMVFIRNSYSANDFRLSKHI